MRYLAIFVCLFGIASGVTAAEPAAPDSAFETLKALAGEWAGQRDDGATVKVTYEVYSNGSAVVETITPPDEPNMVTVYHLDGQDLRLTHYCAAKNQPRMKAKSVSPDGRLLSFEFVDATNLARPTDGHMHALEITFLDSDRIRHKWTWMENEQKRDNVFDLARVK